MSVDPVELEVMRSLLEAAAEEMGLTLQRVSFSANIKERRDFSCAIFNSSGELLAQAAHIPVHLGSMPASVHAILARLGVLRDGDVAIVNDPFAGGTHLPDITLVAPIYEAGQLIGYAANRAHHADVGGASPGSMTLSRHIDEEGFRIEPSLLKQGDAWNQKLLEALLSAVRTPDERRGDLEAQIAANRVGVDAVRRVVRNRGADYVAQYGRALLDHAQAFMSRAIDAIPDGQWRAEDVLDDDGAGSGPVKLRVLLQVKGDRVYVDLRESDSQVAGCVNCPKAVTESAVYYCFACLLDDDAPLNGGSFRNIDVITRPGTVVDATYPAAVVAGNTETSQRIVDVVFAALAQALPQRIAAASCGTMNSIALGGTLPDGRAWTYYETVGGGSGASPAGNGASAVQCHMTNTLNTPAEAIELQYPLRIRAFQRANGSGGDGAFTGGDGIIREIEALADCEGTIISDRNLSQPYGLSGGTAARAGSHAVISASGAVDLAGKSRFYLRRGDVLRVITPGGGGFGKHV